MVEELLAQFAGIVNRRRRQAAEILAGAEVAYSVDPDQPDTANTAGVVEMVWLEYRDEGRTGYWQDIWHPDPQRTDQLVLAESRLVA